MAIAEHILVLSHLLTRNFVHMTSCAPQELAWVAQKYGAANLRRRNGQDLVPVGPASELPMRVAAQQLAALAGMSQKVSNVCGWSDICDLKGFCVLLLLLLRRPVCTQSMQILPIPAETICQVTTVHAGLQVQEAIVNSQAVFMRQVQLKERAFATRVLHSWRDISRLSRCHYVHNIYTFFIWTSRSLAVVCTEPCQKIEGCMQAMVRCKQ
jgi:hypothetical protein